MTENPRIALVTGANKGIGRETAAQLAALGMTVLLGARDPERGEAAASALRAAGGDIQAVALDVTVADTVLAAARAIDELCGRLDVLVNNAGITGGYGQGPVSADLDTVRAVFDTNYFGVMRVTNAMLPAGLLANGPAEQRQATPGVRPFWMAERDLIEAAITAFAGNIGRAAAALEISPSTIYRKREGWARQRLS